MGSSKIDVEIGWASEHHLRLSLDEDSNKPVGNRLTQALAALENARLPGLIGITPASATLLLEFSLAGFDGARTINAVRRVLAGAFDTTVPSPTHSAIIEIPVCYDPSCAPDALDVAHIHGITPDELIRLHAGAEYTVQFIGFVPGFGYLSSLPERLNTPRLDTPRTRVPAGSVGIAADQTGVYPGNTAGGWRLIGRTPLRMFDAARDHPSLLARGDRVRFVPISLAKFNELQQTLQHHG